MIFTYCKFGSFSVERSVAFTYAAVDTYFQESFRNVESKRPNYFLFEPGLHSGFKF
jgi:hypothetical protein